MVIKFEAIQGKLVTEKVLFQIPFVVYFFLGINLKFILFGKQSNGYEFQTANIKNSSKETDNKRFQTERYHHNPDLVIFIN